MSKQTHLYLSFLMQKLWHNKKWADCSVMLHLENGLICRVTNRHQRMAPSTAPHTHLATKPKRWVYVTNVCSFSCHLTEINGQSLTGSDLFVPVNWVKLITRYCFPNSRWITPPTSDLNPPLLSVLQIHASKRHHAQKLVTLRVYAYSTYNPTVSHWLKT